MSKNNDDGCAVCGEVYQVVGALWNGETNIVPVLDNLYTSATGKPIPHETLLPFVPKYAAERVALVERVDAWLATDYGEINLDDEYALMRDIRAYLGGDA